MFSGERIYVLSCPFPYVFHCMCCFCSLSILFVGLFTEASPSVLVGCSSKPMCMLELTSRNTTTSRSVWDQSTDLRTEDESPKRGGFFLSKGDRIIQDGPVWLELFPKWELAKMTECFKVYLFIILFFLGGNEFYPPQNHLRPNMFHA